MSGRGRQNNYGRGRSSGRGFRGNYNNRSGNNSNNNSSNRNNNNRNNTQNKSNSELKFTPHYSGKQQMATYDTVKEHIIQQIQKTYQYGNDMASSLCDLTYTDTPGGAKPIRRIVTAEQ